MDFPRFNIPEEDNPIYMAYCSCVLENDATDRVPIHIGKNILIVTREPLEREHGGHMTLCVESHCAFGDGRHPTTVLCMTLLEEYLLSLTQPEKNRLAMLDLGTGTGILSILAARMGLDNILALDIDPDSITNAEELARLNRAPSIKFSLMDAALLPPVPAYGLITANLLPPILRTVIPLCARLSLPGAPVIVSGIGDVSTDEMEELMRDSGFTELRRITSGWWHAYLLRQ